MVIQRVLHLHAALVFLAIPLAAASAPDAVADPAAPLRDALAQADAARAAEEPQIAESRYRTVLLEGWLLDGALQMAAGDLPAARAALERASTAAVETRRALTSLAIVELQQGDAKAAVESLRPVVTAHPADGAARRLLAQALVAAGTPEQAVEELEEGHAAAPGDPELAFALASGYLRMGKPADAERLFAELAAARPLAQTQVLIGRTYRDFGQHDRARAAFAKALAMDPRVRRAHYYLGTLALLNEEGPELDLAISELQRELALYPDDEAARLYLGMALVEAHRAAEAFPALQAAAHGKQAQVDALYYLGRCLLALDRNGEAAQTLRRALAQAPAEGTDKRQVQRIEYELALALRRQGHEAQAKEHFAAAQSLTTELAQASRDRLARYLRDAPEPVEPAQLQLPGFAATALAELAPTRRAQLRHEVEGALARSYLDLGVMRLQSGDFQRAIDLLSPAAELDPELPTLQRALGVARFNAQQYPEAATALAAALAREPSDAELRRLLALARLETRQYAEAASLLAGDAQLATDPSLQYAYALALVRSGKAADAQEIFDQLLRQHSDWPELHVLLGQAYAASNDFDAAVRELQRALSLSATVADAHATLGSMYLRQGKLPEAEAELRAELASRPQNVDARYQLATVLELAGKREEAITLLVAALKDAPQLADGRYLLGKMLLARGDTEAAAGELEIAARLAPKDANIHYQLGQAYQKLGRSELAQQQFAAYRELKRGERPETPAP